jgi:hypothetical protein
MTPSCHCCTANQKTAFAAAGSVRWPLSSQKRGVWITGLPRRLLRTQPETGRQLEPRRERRG